MVAAVIAVVVCWSKEPVDRSLGAVVAAAVGVGGHNRDKVVLVVVGQGDIVAVLVHR